MCVALVVSTRPIAWRRTSDLKSVECRGTKEREGWKGGLEERSRLDGESEVEEVANNKRTMDGCSEEEYVERN